MSKSVKPENRTMEVILKELNESVDLYNLSSDPAGRVQMDVEHKKLVQEYNEAALLSAYAKAKQAEYPVIELVKMFYYDTVSVKDTMHKEVIDGVTKSISTRSVNDGKKKLNVMKFVEWTAESNNCVAAGRDYRSKTEAARKAIEAEWRKFFASKGDSHSMSIGKAKKALQEMFDALVFIPSETGKNAVIATGDIAKVVLGFSNSLKDGFVDGNVNISGEILSKTTWGSLQLVALHLAATKKSYDLVFGTEAEEQKAEAEEAKKSEAKKKTTEAVAEAEAEAAK